MMHAFLNRTLPTVEYKIYALHFMKHDEKSISSTDCNLLMHPLTLYMLWHAINEGMGN